MLKLKVLGAVAAAATLTGLVFAGVQSGIRHRYGISDLFVLGAAWLVFAAGALLVRRLPVRIAVAMILIGGAAMELAAFSGPPHLSDDVFRYIWDGRVQGAGIDPYEYVPAAPQLAGFRDPALWPATSHWCIGPGTPDPDQPAAALLPGCSRLNRPWVHTIYPPVAEAYFFAVDEASPAGSGTRPMQAGAGLMALAVTGVLLAGLHKLGRDPRSAVLWAWCPAVAFEAGNDAHVDVLAAGLTVASLVVLARARTRGRAVAGGGLLGLAIATKLYPALVAPAIVRRRPVAVASAAAAAVAAVYLPHLLAVGGRVLGYLPGYLQEEGYGNGTRFALLQQVVPQAWCAPAAVAIMAATALVVMRYTDPLRPADGAVVMVGAALIVTSPAYPWYTEVAVALAALAGRAEWLPLAVAAYLPIFGKDAGMSYTKGIVAGYLTAAAVAVIVTAARVLRQRRAAHALTVARAGAQVQAQEPGPAAAAGGPALPRGPGGCIAQPSVMGRSRQCGPARRPRWRRPARSRRGAVWPAPGWPLLLRRAARPATAWRWPVWPAAVRSRVAPPPVARPMARLTVARRARRARASPWPTGRRPVTRMLVIRCLTSGRSPCHPAAPSPMSCCPASTRPRRCRMC